MFLFIDSLLKGDYSALKIKLAIVGIMWLFVLTAIIIDLISGYSKAKQNGEFRTSYGLKRTVSKFTLYYSGLFCAFMIDSIILYVISSFAIPVPSIPYITIIGSGFLIYVEFRSVMEKASEKERTRFTKSLEELIVLLEKRGDIKEALPEVIKKLKKEDEPTNKN